MGQRKNIREVSHSELFLFLLKPFVVSAFLIVIISSGARWFFEYTLEIEGIAANIWLFWIPGFFTLLFWVVFLRRRINLLELPDLNGNGNFLGHCLIILSLALTGIFGQFYQKRNNLEMIDIQGAREIDPASWNACYDFLSIQLDKKLTTGDQFAEVFGRHNQDIRYSAYILAPFGESEDGRVIFWVGKVYDKSISNRSSDSQKHKVWTDHYATSFERFQLLKKANQEYLYPVQRGEDFGNYTSAINRIDWPTGTQHRVFEFYTGDIDAEANHVILGSFLSFLIGIILLWLYSLFGLINTSAYHNFRSGKLKLGDTERTVFEFLLLKGNYQVTVIISYLCLLGYLISAFIDGNLFSLKTERLLLYGALSKDHIANGEVWRLFSHMFLHAGLMHIAYNLVVLGLIGAIIEPVVGKLKFVMIYLITGLGSAYLSLTYNDSISVGASGAIFGLLGWYISASFVYKKRLGDSRNFVLFVIGYVCLSFLLGLLMMQVDHYAHLGGLLAGLILGVAVPPKAVC